MQFIVARRQQQRMKLLLLHQTWGLGGAWQRETHGRKVAPPHVPGSERPAEPILQIFG